MKPTQGCSRRRFLATSGIIAAVGVAAVALPGCQGESSHDRQLSFKTLDEALAEMRRLTPAVALAPATAWNWAQTLAHCAQSIEYSLTGFPESKPALFQQTVGAAAFTVFAWQGRMSHDLGAVIPGAPLIPVDTIITDAMARLERAVLAFQTTLEPLKPHFAYGELGPAEYELAQAMHMANHFSAFTSQA